VRVFSRVLWRIVIQWRLLLDGDCGTERYWQRKPTCELFEFSVAKDLVVGNSGVANPRVAS